MIKIIKFLMLYTVLLSAGNCTFFQNPSFKGVPKLPYINPQAGEKRLIFFHDQIFAIFDTTLNNDIIRCEIIDV